MGGPGGFGGPGGPRSRPYGPPPPRDSRDFGRPFPPLPPPGLDRLERDPYFHYIMDREAFYARLSRDRDFPLLSDRDRLPPPRDFRDDYPDRFMPPPPRSFMEERSRDFGPLSDSYFGDRDPIASRPPPEFYDR